MDDAQVPQKSEGNPRVQGVGWLLAGAAVFGLCSLVQGAFGTTMFEHTLKDPGLVGRLVVNTTWLLGWLFSALFVIFGAYLIFARSDKD